MLARLSDCEGIDFAALRAIQHSDSLAVEAVPVGKLPAAAGGDDLGLVGVVDDLLEHRRLEETHDSSVIDDVPDDAGAVVGGGDGLGVVLIDLDIRNSASVLL